MADKKNESGFTVTDRRLFTAEGELRKDTVEEAAAPAQKAITPADADSTPKENQVREDLPAPPTPAEQQEQKDAYQKSTRDLDASVELGGHSARDFEMTFERFMASLYMTAMLQLGLMHEEGGTPRVDLIGARQTIDTISLLAAKTKGNLTAAEETFLQNSLYELRMAYVEVTNALARPPQSPGPPATPKSR